MPATPPQVLRKGEAELLRVRLHPVRNPKLASFRTQPLENLSAAVKLPINKRFLGNPTLGQNLGWRILAMRTGCTIEGNPLRCKGIPYYRRKPPTIDSMSLASVPRLLPSPPRPLSTALLLLL